jgi:Protein of unknown function (DUF2971)
MQEPQLIYHYTSADSLHGIISQRKMWLTDWRFLNDRNEVYEGLEIASKLIDELFDGATLAFQRERLLSYLDPKTIHIFIASFCESADSVPHWQSYAMNGLGYAIGFNTQKLRETQNEVFLERVSYNDKIVGDRTGSYRSAEQEMRDFISSALAGLTGDHSSFFRAAFKLPLRVSTVKHGHFAHEKEWRWILPLMSHTWDEGSTPRTANVFFPKDGILIPRTAISLIPKGGFFRVGLEDPIVHSTAIENIVIGPRLDQELAEVALRTFLNKHNYEDVTITKSSSPYR